MEIISNRKYLKQIATTIGGWAVYQTEVVCFSSAVSTSELLVEILLSHSQVFLKLNLIKSPWKQLLFYIICEYSERFFSFFFFLFLLIVIDNIKRRKYFYPESINEGINKFRDVQILAYFLRQSCHQKLTEAVEQKLFSHSDDLSFQKTLTSLVLYHLKPLALVLGNYWW